MQQQPNTLKTVWRKLVLTTALSTSLLAGGTAMAQSKTTTAPDNAPQGTVMMLPQAADTAKLPSMTPAQAAELTRRVRITTTLVTDAQKKFVTLSQQAETSYSKDLVKQGKQLEGRLAADPQAKAKTVTVLDPNRFDAGVALGVSPVLLVRDLLGEKGIEASGPDLIAMTAHMASQQPYRYGIQMYTQDPLTIPDASTDKNGACVIVPSSDHSPYLVPGFTYNQRLSFINRHEGWHCLDDRYPTAPVGQSIGLQGRPIADVLADKELMQTIANQTRKEALADVGALGDMIRFEGASLDVLDAASTWRAANPHDILHISSPVIDAFKAHVAAYGIENFRKLPDNVAAEFYYGAVEEAGHTAKSVEYSLLYEATSRREQMAVRAKLDKEPEFHKALKYHQIYMRAEPAQADPAAPLTTAENAVYQQVRAYNGFQALDAKAFELDGKITPASLIHAYGQLQEGLLAKLKADPENAATPALMTKLQQSLLYGITRMDYVAANARHGVDIVKQEPSLAAFAKPADAGKAPQVENKTPKAAPRG
ncbi:MAG: hypothetical protein PW788_12885 [Micavibrio sp.]|nr:hypothetical protein [Micavibrio sp.]